MNTQTTSVRVAAALTALFLLAGCSGPGVSDGARSAPVPQQAVPAGVPAAAPADGATDAAQPYQTDERQVARTAALTVVVPSPVDAAARVREIASAHGGYVTREEVRSQGERPTGTVVVSVPADQVDATLKDLAGLGELAQRSQTATDVTDKVVDVDARVRTLQESITRTRALMERAGSVAEIAAVERELTTRQSELESLLAQQKALRDRVARTPITVTLTTTQPGVTSNPFLDGLRGAWEALQSSVRVVLVILGFLLPWAVIAALVWFPVRAWFKKHPRPPRPASVPYIAFPAGYSAPVPQQQVQPDVQPSVPQDAAPAEGGPDRG